MAMREIDGMSPDTNALLDRLSFWADRIPEKAAITDGRRSLTYAEFRRDALRCQKALWSFGIRPGHLIGIGLADPTSHWLIAIAAEAIGATTFSYISAPKPASSTMRLICRADALFAEVAPPYVAKTRVCLCTGPWWSQVLGGSADGDDAIPSARPAIVRIIQSSGTTGEAKAIPIDRTVFAARMRHAIETEQISGTSIYLLAHPFTVAAVFTRTAACLWLGATLFVGPARIGLTSGNATHLYLMPGDLAALLAALPADLPRPANRLTVVTGASLTPALRAEAQSCLGGRVLSAYGTNETTLAAYVDDDGIATLFPHCRARFLGADGKPVPPGEAGSIALESPDTAGGYLGDAELTDWHFRNGWFLTSDLGIGLDERKFRLIGRADDLLNLGGRKLAAEPLERALSQGPAESAVAAMSGDNLLIGLVPKPEFDWKQVEAETLAALGRLLPDWRGPVRIIRLDALPRTGNGKLRRAALREMA